LQRALFSVLQRAGYQLYTKMLKFQNFGARQMVLRNFEI